MEISNIAKTIEDCATNLDKVKEAIEEGGMMAAMPFAATILSTFNQIQKYGNLDGVDLSSNAEEISSAIEHFLKSADNAAKAAPEAVKHLGQEKVLQVVDNLEQVLKQLDKERGGHVHRTENEGGM